MLAARLSFAASRTRVLAKCSATSTQSLVRRDMGECFGTRMLSMCATPAVRSTWGRNRFAEVRKTHDMHVQKRYSSSAAENPAGTPSSQDAIFTPIFKHVPDFERNPFYMTTPIFYVNGEPHIGHLYTMLIADITCRWKRLNGTDVFLMAGTDEHGAKVQEASEKAGFESPLAFCDKVSETFRDAWTLFDIQHDAFVRTTSAEHAQSVSWMWQQLERNGYIYKGKHEGWYCRSDETFVPEIQLVKHEDGSLRTASGHTVEWISEDNYKFRLSAFAPLLQDYYAANPDAIAPANMRTIVQSMLAQGMEDISISRLASKLQWGVPVPGDAEHKVYVWLDALNIYLTGARNAAKKAKFRGALPALLERSSNTDASTVTSANTTPTSELSAEMLQRVQAHAQAAREDPESQRYLAESAPFWPNGVQLIGKDILKFHCIYWPAFLLGSGLPLPRRTVAHSHWTVEGQKMSKSLGNVLSPATLAERYGVDNTRYGLMRIGNIQHDTNFTDLDLVKIVNNELNDVLGNLAMRATAPALLPSQLYPDPLRAHRTLTADVFDAAGEWYQHDPALFTAQELDLQARINALPQLVDNAISRSRMDEAFEHVTEVGRAANVYFTAQEPWKLMSKGAPKDDAAAARVEMTLYHCIEAVRVCALCLQCIVPTSAARLLDQIAVPVGHRVPLAFGRFGWRPAVIGGDAALNTDAGNVNGMWEGMDHVTVGRAAVREAPFAKLVMEEEKVKADKERIAAERREQAAKAKAIAAAARGEGEEGEVSKRQLKKLAKKEAKAQRKAEAKATSESHA